MKTNWSDKLKEIPSLKFYSNCNLKKYSTMRLNSYGDMVHAFDEESLSQLLKVFHAEGLSYRILGLGSNQILSAKENEVFLKVDFPFSSKDVDTFCEEYLLPASFPLSQLSTAAMRLGLKGFEVFTGIPASLGGAVFMNAGTRLGEIGSLVKKVHLLKANGDFKTVHIEKTENYFAYRKNFFCDSGEVITAISIAPLGQDDSTAKKIEEYKDYRMKTQPLNQKTCGCVFVNPSKDAGAGKLIDLAGLKGFSVGGLRVSLVHANFFENIGEATEKDFFSLVDIVREKVLKSFNVELELEVKF